MRKIVSLVMLYSMVFLAVSSVVLFIRPEGRVAYWANWSFWGLSKSQWDRLHVCVGFLFLLAGLLHIYYNWKSIVTYLKNSLKEVTGVNKNNIVAIIATLVVAITSMFDWFPSKQFMGIGEFFKERATKLYGTPPFGHAELATVGKVSRFLGLDKEKAFLSLKASGISFGKDSTLAEIGEANNRSPKEIFDIVLKDQKDAIKMPPLPAEGTGKKSVNDICIEFNLDCAKVIDYLMGRGIKVDGGKKLKIIGDDNNLLPADIYKMIRESQ